MSIEDILVEWEASKACKRLKDKQELNRINRKTKKTSKPKKSSSKVIYSEYITSDAWKKKRRKILRQRGNRCEFCQSSKNLQLHHLTYVRLGREQPNDLQVLCRDCHASMHENKGAESVLTTEFISIVNAK